MGDSTSGTHINTGSLILFLRSSPQRTAPSEVPGDSGPPNHTSHLLATQTSLLGRTHVHPRENTITQDIIQVIYYKYSIDWGDQVQGLSRQSH